MTRVYVGLGSNLGDSAGIARDALDELRSLGANFVNSDLYLTMPWGKRDQPDFINAVVAFDTERDPEELLRQLKSIETRFHRRRDEHWGPRTLDLDLLLYGNKTIADKLLIVPHPLLRERAFVLEPLAEIAAGVLVPPDGVTAQGLRDALPVDERQTVRRLRGTASLTRPPHVDYDAPGGAGEEYKNLRPFSQFDRAVLDAVLEVTGPLAHERVLDVGCGTGRFTEKLADEGARVVGIDPSETMLREARARRNETNQDIEYVSGGAGDGLPAGPFAAITAFYCIQYLDIAEFAQHASVALEPGGVLVIITFPHQHFAEVEFGRFFPSLPAIDMGRFPSVPVVERALQAAGFERIEARDVRLRLDDDPQLLLERVKRKYLSSFFLLPEREFTDGVEQMQREWQGQDVVRREALGVVISGRRPRS